jgi:hypothetical protein
MSRTLFVALSASLMLAGTALAGKKKKSKDVAVATPKAAAAVPTTPADATSKKFGVKLMSSTLVNFRPSDAGGATFQYDKMTFGADNTWKAAGWVEFDDEKMECDESGNWTMEAADSDKVANVTWKVAKTDCAGREPGSEVRAQLTLSKDGTIDAKFR